MTSKARVKSALMNILIALLSLSAAYLFILSIGESPARVFENLFGGDEDTVVSSGGENLSGVSILSPHVILLTDENGTHYAAKYDYQAKTRLFSQYSVTLGEALGSVSNVSQVTETEWREVLGAPGIFVDYLYPQPLSLIAGQLGTSLPDGLTLIMTGRLCLAQSGEDLFLYYIDGVSGEFFRFETALKTVQLSQRPSEAGLPAASLAFESDGGLARFDPYFVYSGERLAINAVQSVSPLSLSSESPVSLSVFSMNERATTPYSDGDFTKVYVEGTKSLRISTSGSVLFTVTGSNTDGIPVSFSGDSPSLNDCIRSAAALVSATVSPLPSDAEIGLVEVRDERGRGGSCVLTFRYYVNGIPVQLSGAGWCARITISGRNIVRAELEYRTMTIQDELLPTLPEEQAAILAVSKSGAPLLLYEESDGVLNTAWHNDR